MRTCREMAIPTVAVYAEPDARSPHAVFADERVALSGPAPRQAYLDLEQIVRTARQHGADAIHPGYGFLSENPAFAEACAKNGLTFIGPPATSMGATMSAPPPTTKSGVLTQRAAPARGVGGRHMRSRGPTPQFRGELPRRWPQHVAPACHG